MLARPCKRHGYYASMCANDSPPSSHIQRILALPLVFATRRLTHSPVKMQPTGTPVN